MQLIPIRALCLFRLVGAWAGTILFLVSTGPVLAQGDSVSARSLTELQNLAATNTSIIASFSLTGLVCAAQSESRLVALQDRSGTVLLELPQLDSSVHAGNWLVMGATNAIVRRTPFGLKIGTGPLAEIDGIHRALSRSGSVYLETGRQPIRVEWFNGAGSATLDVEWAGTDLPRQPVSTSALWHGGASESHPFQPGLNFAAYLGGDWTQLPDFSRLQPVVTGVATNFNLDYRPRPDQVALMFSGFLQISNAGIYTFYIRSDDGGRLFVGTPAAQCGYRLLEHTSPPPTPRILAQALADRSNGQWVSLEGRVTFAGQVGSGLELEVMNRDQPVSVLVVNSAVLAETNLAQQRVRITGICELPNEARAPRIIVPGAEQLAVLHQARDLNPEEPLTTAAQVRELQPDEARRQLRVRVRGVVTMANYWSCVIQDLTGGVFVRHVSDEWERPPAVGELWEFEGVTDPGDFSPVVRTTNGICLGSAVLPEPIRPTWDQLVNGSMDAELIEVQGVLTDISDHEMTLLTRDGKVKILEKEFYPLPHNSTFERAAKTLPGSVVRIRGVFAAEWDYHTRRLNPGRFFLGNSMLSVDEPTPENLFSVQARRLTDLLLFTSHVGALTRVKVTGQVLYARPREYFLTDGPNGFRVLTKEPLPVTDGDLVEAVGFPQLGGPSPVLIEAQARKVGSAPRPAPISLSATNLSDESNDARLVRVEALLLSDTVRQGERWLELQSGQHHFQARLRTNGKPAETLRRLSRLQLTGVYASTRDSESAGELDSFELLLAHPGDIVVLQSGPWWTPRHTIATIGILFSALMASVVWITSLRRTVAQRTARLEKEIHTREQVEQRRILEQERTRVAQDLHDELGAGLAQIGLIGSLAQRPQAPAERARQHLAEITEKSREMIAVLDEIVWAINPKHDSTASVSSYFCDYAAEFLQPTTVACRLDIGSVQQSHSLNSIQRHQLFLAFKEALTNVVKHSFAAEVWIRIAAENGHLCVSVEDNGRGIAANGGEENGNGVGNMRRRLEKIGGRCEIRVRSAGGTVVRFELPEDGKAT